MSVKGIGKREGRVNSGGEPRRAARTMRPLRVCHHKHRMLICATESRWIGANGGPVGGFPLFGLFVCLRISVLLLVIVVFSFYTGHCLRAPRCMINK